MRVADRERQDVVHELLVHRGEVRGRMWHRRMEARAHGFRNRLPHRPRAYVLEIIEHLVEHAVALCARAGPVGGVESASVCLLIHSPQSSMNSLTISFRAMTSYVMVRNDKIAGRSGVLTIC